MDDNTKMRRQALEYHRYPMPGKIETVPTKPYDTAHDLALAYSPGVAYPSLEIEKHPDDDYRYTGRGNLVAVISNGTAVLGLGDIGARASKPVMEGKAMLFKIFADIDCHDIEVNEKDPVRFAETVAAIAGTFGGINLEDIKAPECFEIENRLTSVLDIPVMHDDQHGTAIVTAAALTNALKIQHKDIGRIRIVVNGAGAAAMACVNLLTDMGLDRSKLIMCDSRGVISMRRTDLTALKRQYAADTDMDTLAQAMQGADVFLGLSKADTVTPGMLRAMAPRPIVFALANPAPEIAYDLAMASRNDIIFATGRSDLPNQVNNVLGFPYIFRGALDVRATAINLEMKLAAVRALADLARQPVTPVAAQAIGRDDLKFGPSYIIPSPFDPRLLTTVAPAVAKAAMQSGVARRPIADMDAYAVSLASRMRTGRDTMAAVLKAEYSPRVRG